MPAPSLATVILVVVVLAFAWNLGVHYTGAVMGMPYAARAIAHLAIVWVCAPVAACVLGFAFTRLLDLVIPPAAAREQVRLARGYGLEWLRRLIVG